jgi:hypothetical protein
VRGDHADSVVERAAQAQGIAELLIALGLDRLLETGV